MSVFNNGLYDAVFEVASEQAQYEEIDANFQAFQESYNQSVVNWGNLGTTYTLVPTVETVDSGAPQVLSYALGLPKGVYICWMDATFTGSNPATGYLGCQLTSDDGQTTIDPNSNTQAEFSSSFTWLQTNTSNNNNNFLSHQHVGVLNGLSPLYDEYEFTNILFFAKCDTASEGGQYGMTDSHIYITRIK